MGNIAKRRDGKWRARYRDAAGKEHAKHFDRKVEAERWLATVHVALIRGEWVDPAMGRTTLGDWASTWSEGLGHLKPSTRARYVNIYEVHVRPRWGEVQLARITHGEIAAWLAKLLGDGVAAATVRQIYRVLALILDLAVRDGRLPRSPAVGVRLPRADQVEKRFLTHAQVAQLAHACSPPSDLVVLVLAYTGLRWGELAALRKRDVNLDSRRIIVNRAVTEIAGKPVYGTPKNHQRREVPVPAFLIDRLAEHVALKGPEDLVFTSPRGGLLWRNNFRLRVFDRAAASVGLSGLTPHELRHTAASLAIAAGANVKAVQRMLGHASAAMTLDVYAGLFGDDLDVVATNLDLAARAAGADQVRTERPQSTP